MVSVSSCEKVKEPCLKRLARQASVLHVESQVREYDAHMRPYWSLHPLDEHLVVDPDLKILVSVTNVYKMGAHVFGATDCVPIFPNLDGS